MPSMDDFIRAVKGVNDRTFAAAVIRELHGGTGITKRCVLRTNGYLLKTCCLRLQRVMMATAPSHLSHKKK
jgi:hypothetical protein